MMRIAIAQINSIVGDLMGNRRRIAEGTARARDIQADLVIFPEMSVTGYPPEDLLHKRHFIRDNLACLRSLIKETAGITAVVGFVDEKKGFLYNAAAVIQGKKLLAVYHKQALPNYGVFDEKRYFHAGRENGLFTVNGVKCGINICEDIWVEDGIYRAQAAAGARVLINISSSPYHEDKLEQRKTLLKRRAVQTKTFLCYANLVGGQDELVFDGGSMMWSPQGRLMAIGRQFEEDFIAQDMEVYSARRKNVHSRKIRLAPVSREYLTKDERIYKALVLGLRDYTQKNGFAKVVIGLSGGIDSALAAVIAVDALGRENVIGVTMPSRYTSSATNADAKTLAGRLGIACIEIAIEGIFTAYLEALAGEFKAAAANIAEENIQARIRGNLLMALSNKFGWMVLTTGNKSEIAVGYCTLYGDMSGGFAVIKDVPKTKVYALARLRNGRSGEGLIPESVFERAPTAELRHNQKDQDALPPYDALDGVLKDYVERHCSFSRISKNVDRETVKKVIALVDRSEYKRRQAPPGVKITARAFGKDWRLPITNKYQER